MNDLMREYLESDDYHKFVPFKVWVMKRNSSVYVEACPFSCWCHNPNS